MARSSAKLRRWQNAAEHSQGVTSSTVKLAALPGSGGKERSKKRAPREREGATTRTRDRRERLRQVKVAVLDVSTP